MDKNNFENNRPKDDININKTNSQRKYYDDSLLAGKHKAGAFKDIDINTDAQESQIQHNNFPVGDFKKSDSLPKPVRSSLYEDENGMNIYDKYTNYNNYKQTSLETRKNDSAELYSSDYDYEEPYGSSALESFNSAERGGRKMKKNPYDGAESEKDASKSQKAKTKKKKIIRNILIAVCVLLVIGGSAAFGISRAINKIKPDDEFKPKPVDTIKKGIKNVVLFGVDSESGKFSGHSDVIMVVSVNFDTADVKIISILRDSYVEIEGYKKQKITHAYGYGGPELAVNTINQNFDLDIQDYVTVNFESFAEIIDVLEGVEIDVTEREKNELNYHGSIAYKNFKPLKKTGKVVLNGQQAVSYARLRYDTDNNRALRQREVLEQIYTKVMAMPATKYTQLVTTLMPYVKTSLEVGEIIDIMKVLPKGIKIHQTSVPDYKYEKDLVGKQFGGKDSPWEWRYDTHEAGKRIYRFIYEDDYSSEIDPNLPTADEADKK